MEFEINEFSRKKRKILNYVCHYVLDSVHTFVVYRSIAAMYKLTITPHGEYRTFLRLIRSFSCIDI